MANKHMERCSRVLVIKEMQSKITVSYHFTPTRMPIPLLKRKEKIKNNSVGQNVDKLELSFIAVGNVNWCHHCEEA